MDTIVKDKKDQAAVPFKTVIGEVLVTIREFSDLLEKETSALKICDFETVDSLQELKRLYAKRYEANVLALAERQADFSTLDLPTREKLMGERVGFNDVLSRNLHALELVKESNARLINYILESARKTVTDDHQVNYSKTGQAATYRSAAKSLAISQEA